MKNRKYPKVTGSWTYGHIIVPEKLIYIGSSDEPECCHRWKPSAYKEIELYPYIEKYGWDNIKHIVFKDGLTPEQAKQLEGLLIAQAKIDGWCINKNSSGGETRNRKLYDKQYRKQYYTEHKNEILECMKQYSKQQYSTPEGKIYRRVQSFNRYHPDRIIETPLEAKQKYLESGYIPNYIKNNDLTKVYRNSHSSPMV